MWAAQDHRYTRGSKRRLIRVKKCEGRAQGGKAASAPPWRGKRGARSPCHRSGAKAASARLRGRRSVGGPLWVVRPESGLRASQGVVWGRLRGLAIAVGQREPVLAASAEETSVGGLTGSNASVGTRSGASHPAGSGPPGRWERISRQGSDSQQPPCRVDLGATPLPTRGRPKRTSRAPLGNRPRESCLHQKPSIGTRSRGTPQLEVNLPGIRKRIPNRFTEAPDPPLVGLEPTPQRGRPKGSRGAAVAELPQEPPRGPTRTKTAA